MAVKGKRRSVPRRGTKPAQQQRRRTPGSRRVRVTVSTHGIEPTPSSPPAVNSALEFALHYVANGFNATAAYKSVHPGVTDGTARVEGSRTLAKPNVREAIAARLEHRWRGLHVSGDEALALVANDARVDLRLLVDEHGRRLALKDWPDELQTSVEALEFDEAGGVKKVKTTGKLAARRLILEVTGKVKNQAATSIDALAELIRQDIEEHAKR